MISSSSLVSSPKKNKIQTFSFLKRLMFVGKYSQEEEEKKQERFFRKGRDELIGDNLNSNPLPPHNPPNITTKLYQKKKRTKKRKEEKKREKGSKNRALKKQSVFFFEFRTVAARFERRVVRKERGLKGERRRGEG